MGFEEALKVAVRDAVLEAMPKAQPAKRVMSTREAAKYLSCSVSHIINLVSMGLLKTVDMGTGGKKTKLWFDVNDLNDFVEKRK